MLAAIFFGLWVFGWAVGKCLFFGNIEHISQRVNIELIMIIIKLILTDFVH